MITKKSRFVNYKALKKTFKTFRNDDFIEAGRPAYVKASRQILNKAKRNAPKKTGKMSRRIRFIGDANRKTTKGSLLNYTVYSNSIQDKLITEGVPDRKLSGKELTNLSRTIRGKRYRPKPAGNFTKGDKRREKYYKRNWAWGNRKPNRFMTEGQNFDKVLDTMAEDIAMQVIKGFDRKFSRLAG